MVRVAVQEAPVDAAAALAGFGRAPGAGAIVTFTGQVRGSDGGERIEQMTLEHYPGMTERQIAAIAEEACRRWSLEDCLVIHRVGSLVPGETIVLVATAAAHRSAAFESAAYLMDWLKTQAPFWKREKTPSGMRWVAARASDEAAAARWKRS